MIEEDLWIDGGVDDLAGAVPAKRGKPHIGCPLAWFKLVFPVARSKQDLAVALSLWRLHSMHPERQEVSIPNGWLSVELGIDRFAKYRALRRLAEAGVITIRRRNKRALEVALCRHRKPKKSGV